MLCCVGCLSWPEPGSSEGGAGVATEQDKVAASRAISFGLLAPVMISLFITWARYFTLKHRYNSTDFTVDTFTLLGLIEVPFFLAYQLATGYTLFQLTCGLFASFAQICGTGLLIYASTYGLAGPSSALAQCQGLVHVLLSALCLGLLPSRLDLAGVLCAIAGSAVMSIGHSSKYSGE